MITDRFDGNSTCKTASGSRGAMMADSLADVWRLKVIMTWFGKDVYLIREIVRGIPKVFERLFQLLFFFAPCISTAAALKGVIMAECSKWSKGKGRLRETSPLVMEEIEFSPHVHGDRGKRKAALVGARSDKRPRRASRSAGGVVIGSPQRAGENSFPRPGDVGSEFYYVGKTGKKRTVKCSDCSFHSAPIASSLLKGAVLDGDKAEVKDESMETLLGTMDMAACLFLAGYDRLKNVVQGSEADDNSHVELGCMRAAWRAEKRKLEVMTTKYQNAVAENAALIVDLTELDKEVAEVTPYAKKCQGVAREAKKAYTLACAEYATLDEKYHVLKRAGNGEAQEQGMRVMLRSARHGAGSSATPKDKHVLTDV